MPTFKEVARDLLLTIAALTAMPFSDACESWLESRRPYLAPKTAHEYRLNIKVLSEFFGELRLQEIDGDLIRAYQRMRQQKCGPHSINHECCVLLQIRKRIGMPIADYQPLPMPKSERGRALSHEERERLLRIAKSNPNWEAAFLFTSISVNTSAGPKETFTLRLKDVDLERKLIRINPGGAKNPHRARSIPLNVEALAAARRAVERAKGLGSKEPDHYLFPFRNRGSNIHKAHYDPNKHQTSFKTAWLALRKAAQIPGFRQYDLRHHAITALLENPDVSEETVEDIAGHVSRRMKKRYSHIRMEHKRAALDAIVGKKKPVRAVKSTERTAPDDNIKQLATLLSKLLKTR